MIYDFAGKIGGIKKFELLNEEAVLAGTAKEQEGLQSCRVLPSENKESGLLIKAQASVSSLSKPVHDKELEEAVITFKKLLEAVALMLGGEVNKEAGFYNNSTQFNKLY